MAPTPIFNPRDTPSAGQFNGRPPIGFQNSTFGHLGGIFGSPGPWTFAGLGKSFNGRNKSVGTFNPRS